MCAISCTIVLARTTCCVRSTRLWKIIGSRNVTQPGALHRAGVELRDEGLVVVAERVAHPEQPVELVEALPRDREDLLGVVVELAGDRGARAQAERDAVVLVADHVVRPGDQGDQVRRQRQRLGEHPLPGSTSVAGALPRTTQSRGARTRSVHTALRSGWSKHPKMLGRGVEEGHRVDVVTAVRGVDRAVQALAVVAVAHHRVDDHDVLARVGLDRHPAALEQRHVDGPSVDGHGVQRDRLDLDEGGAAAATAGDGADRAEGLLAAVEVERHVVRRHVEQRGPVPGLGVLEAGGAAGALLTTSA